MGSRRMRRLLLVERKGCGVVDGGEEWEGMVVVIGEERRGFI